MKKDNNFLKIILIIWLLVLTGISVCALCRTFYPEVKLELDYLGFIVGILTLLCTVLIGWQIYSVFDFSKREKYSVRRIHELEEHITQSDFLFHNALADTYAKLLNKPIMHHPTYNLVLYRVMSLTKASQLEQDDEIDNLCNEIISDLLKFIKDNEIILNIDEKLDLLQLLRKVSKDSRFPKFKELYSKIFMLNARPSENPKDEEHAEPGNVKNE